MTRRGWPGLVVLSLAALVTLALLAFGWLPVNWLRLAGQVVLPGRPLRALDLPTLSVVRLACGLLGLAGLALWTAALVWRAGFMRLL